MRIIVSSWKTMYSQHVTLDSKLGTDVFTACHLKRPLWKTMYSQHVTSDYKLGNKVFPACNLKIPSWKAMYSQHINLNPNMALSMQSKSNFGKRQISNLEIAHRPMFGNCSMIPTLGNEPGISPLPDTIPNIGNNKFFLVRSRLGRPIYRRDLSTAGLCP